MEEQLLRILDKHIQCGFQGLTGIEKANHKVFTHVMDFIAWYSGMEKEKIERAYQRYLRETKK